MLFTHKNQKITGKNEFLEVQLSKAQNSMFIHAAFELRGWQKIHLLTRWIEKYISICEKKHKQISRDIIIRWFDPRIIINIAKMKI